MTDLVERPSPAQRVSIAQVTDTFVALMQAFVKGRNRMMAAAGDELDWSAHMILRALRTEGPMRAGALADAVQSDPSTVSRQVATLVRDGLLERRADPGDGRAALLVLTERAQEVLAGHDRLRLAHYAQILRDWSDDDITQFVELLRRFTADFETTTTDHWINERRTAARSEGRT